MPSTDNKPATDATPDPFDTVATVLQTVSGYGELVTTGLGAVVPGGLSLPVQLAVRGLFAAAGAVGRMIAARRDPMVTIAAWEPLGPAFNQVDADVNAELAGTGKASAPSDPLSPVRLAPPATPVSLR